MTEMEAEEYAARIYEHLIEPDSIMSGETAALVKDRLAHAYMDGAISILGSLLGSLGAGKPHAPKIPMKSYEHPADHAHIQEETA